MSPESHPQTYKKMVVVVMSADNASPSRHHQVSAYTSVDTPKPFVCKDCGKRFKTVPEMEVGVQGNKHKECMNE